MLYERLLRLLSHLSRSFHGLVHSRRKVTGAAVAGQVEL